MSKNKEKLSISPLSQYPWSIILTRWFFVASELGIAFYFAFTFKMNFGLFFLIYAMICGTVILPLLRCTKCYYYGKRCNFGWGTWVSRIFPKSDDEVFSSSHGLTFLFWPVRVVPIGLGSIQIVAALKLSLSSIGEGLSEASALFVESLDNFNLALLAIYFLVIYLHRKFYRAKACSRCFQREVCPVYNFEMISEDTGNLE